ncbi:hypothetical protein [Paenibacillus alkalitolerans]|nr:hypothetical protein [Paenibacillus alkalitolerans]
MFKGQFCLDKRLEPQWSHDNGFRLISYEQNSKRQLHPFSTHD